MGCVYTWYIYYSFIEERVDISPSRLRLIKLFGLLFASLHLCACFFWRVKVGSRGETAAVMAADGVHRFQMWRFFAEPAAAAVVWDSRSGAAEKRRL